MIAERRVFCQVPRRRPVQEGTVMREPCPNRADECVWKREDGGEEQARGNDKELTEQQRGGNGAQAGTRELPLFFLDSCHKEHKSFSCTSFSHPHHGR